MILSLIFLRVWGGMHTFQSWYDIPCKTKGNIFKRLCLVIMKNYLSTLSWIWNFCVSNNGQTHLALNSVIVEMVLCIFYWTNFKLLGLFKMSNSYVGRYFAWWSKILCRIYIYIYLVYFLVLRIEVSYKRLRRVWKILYHTVNVVLCFRSILFAWWTNGLFLQDIQKLGQVHIHAVLAEIY